MVILFFYGDEDTEYIVWFEMELFIFGRDNPLKRRFRND